MRNIGVVLILMIIISPPILCGNSATAQSSSPSEQELWNHEKTYMTLLQEGNVQGLSEFWHQEFIGWPSHSSKPLDRDEGGRAGLSLPGVVVACLSNSRLQILAVYPQFPDERYRVGFHPHLPGSSDWCSREPDAYAVVLDAGYWDDDGHQRGCSEENCSREVSGLISPTANSRWV